MRLEVILVNFLIYSVGKVSSFVNLAHTPAQSLQGTASWNVVPHGTTDWTAEKAVDGNTNQTYLPTCAIAAYANNYRSVWWKVWLNRKFNIAYLDVYLRDGTTGRATGFSIYIYDDVSYEPPTGDTGRLVHHHNPMSGCPASLQNVTVNKIAQGVAFFNERPDGFTSGCSETDSIKTSIEICEVRVMGCDQIRYHFGCIKLCSTKCKDKHCDAFNGSCIHGCSDPGAVSIDCILCDDGTYAFNDRCEPCGHCQVGTVCDKGTGRCPSGCKEHWSGDLCKECADGYYGQNCSSICGNCLGGRCDKENGSCLSGCQQNWKEPLCQECVDGYYDQTCSTQCGNCREGYCDKKNGSCSSGCKLNWKEPLCQECVDGYYDQNCSSQCGKCREGFCNKTTGYCLSGCKPNWKEPLCQECVDGYYDQNCSTPCGNCLEGFCDKKNGSCPFGCNGNWSEPLCQECIDGFYDQICSTQCGECRSKFCDKNNGSCLNGCKTNWKEPLCQECRDGMYDQNCNSKCGHCREGFCEKKNGSCLTGCKQNWKEPLCQECVDGNYHGDCSRQCGHCLTGVCDKTSGACLNGCSPHWQEPLCQECTNGSYGENCSTQCQNCLGDFCDKKNGSCLTGCKTNWHGPLCKDAIQQEEENNTAIIGGTIPAVIIAVLAGVLLLIIYRRHKNNGGKEGLVENDKHLGFSGNSGKDNETEFFDGACNPGTDQTDDNGYYNTFEFITNIEIGDLRNVIKEKSTGENNQFVQEYKRLPPANLNACQSAKKTENMTKNRFKTTFPCKTIVTST
ncbi:platelet endothelial aggregation receptor 1-like, partial [Saccostrea cucullata]|uniref:platelet endothelial aggregation receptor 1-like n=1 Tax=Saccostrea cuccullata TaxID=36930 RepID=UPI002ED0BDD2